MDKAVEKGDELLIYDNVILNSKNYWEVHPGGRFFLEKNYGRDISKFYLGGYSMV